jgi:hypothetical protein
MIYRGRGQPSRVKRQAKSVFETLVDRRRACVIDVEDVSTVDGWHESGVIPRI